MNQLSLFDPEKYSTPSSDGKPDWFYDTHDGDESVPSVSPKKEENGSTETSKARVDRSQGDADSIPGQFPQVKSTQKSVGGRNSTPGEEAIPGDPKPFDSKDKNLDSTGEGERHITGDRTGGENLDSSAKGDRHITGDRTGAEQNSKNIGMLGNTQGDRSCSIASGLTLLTEEEGRAYWDDLIFGRKTENPGRVACKTTGNSGDRNPGRNDLKRVQDSHHTPDIESVQLPKNAISSENAVKTDRREHNGKPGASGWIGRQYKYRDHLGRSRTSSHWIPGCAGPYYHYQWREGDRVTTIYLPRKKLEAVENAIARRESVNAILMMLG
ncbi:hypothetical protein [Laspinema olomoucense]|uniref:hypothetical protein n=1 Tax=Laspinema olomoucense TaxID=3231600 RepID=UPI0021BAAA4C|nr:hypothetical protein [Laspinema sp. D3a]MCT7988834.1 hypothetical protein [Laspinema sp. D3a]